MLAKTNFDRGLIRSYSLLRNTNKCTVWLQAANEAVGQGSAPADNFKFFFNHCEWLPGALANEVHPPSFRAVALRADYM